MVKDGPLEQRSRGTNRLRPLNLPPSAYRWLGIRQPPLATPPKPLGKYVCTVQYLTYSSLGQGSYRKAPIVGLPACGSVPYQSPRAFVDKA